MGAVKNKQHNTRATRPEKRKTKVETNPGPKNKEPWAGKKKDPNQQP
jgi:hypothetical protein